MRRSPNGTFFTFSLGVVRVDEACVAAFVAERFARVKRQAPRGTSHGEVMRGLAAEWRAEKEARRARGEGATR